jgi:hypothetical protein
LSGISRDGPPSELVELRHGSEDAVEAILHIAKICPPVHARMWGDGLRDALIMELLVSTLSHALNEDLLVARLRRLRAAEPWVLSTDRLAEIDGGEVARWFGLNENQRSKDNPRRLAGLIRANLSHFRDEGDRLVGQLFDPDTSISVDDAAKWLACFPIFGRDPLQKKSSLILQRLYLQGYLPRERYAKLPFAIDRHIVRLFLRMGWITARTPALARKVAHRQIMSSEEDEALRVGARAVMVDLAERSGLSHAEINYVLWQFARSYCARHDPGCLSPQPMLLGRRAELTPQSHRDACLLAQWCTAFHRGTVLSTFDPVHRGDLY